DAILGGKDAHFPSDIVAAYSVGGNLANQGGDAAKSYAALDSLEFSVCHEMFPTPTAMRCDVVLPAASSLEKSDIGIPWPGNFLLYKPRALRSEGLARSDYDIFSELALRMGFGAAFSEGRSESEWIDTFLDASEVEDRDLFKRSGIYLGADQERSGLSDFAADPAAHPLSTPSGKVELESESYARLAGGRAIPVWRGSRVEAPFPLSLVTPKRADRVHSQGSAREPRRPGGEERLQINRVDAAPRGIADGDLVRVRSARGTTRARAMLSEDIMPLVVSLPEGAWLDRDESGEDLAGSPNVLTATDGTGPSDSAVMHGIAVQVEKA
ncbi:MAG: molybdopterin dinucleotide binding domain-containing protein, partial [Spirochaetaceae bacterium]|nr:molybdopterin dinucleotide binding domain-containing protein [Spirochaetaceae bacterium]